MNVSIEKVPSTRASSVARQIFGRDDADFAKE